MAARWSISPLSLLTGHPENRPPAIYLLYDFLRSQWRKTSPRSLHLFQLMCSGAGRPPLVSAAGEKQRAAVSQAPCGSSISPPNLAQPGPEQHGEQEGIDGVLYVCQFNTRRSNGAHVESCCVCIINMCVGVYVALRLNMELTLIRESDGNLLTSFWTTCRCDRMEGLYNRLPSAPVMWPTWNLNIPK